MANHNLRRCMSHWRRGWVASLILAGPVATGALAAAPEPDSSQITSRPSTMTRRLADAPNRDLLTGMIASPESASPDREYVGSAASRDVETVAAEEESRGGIFPLFRRDNSNTTNRDSDRPSLFGRMRRRMMRPFRDDAPAEPEQQQADTPSSEPRVPNVSPPQPPPIRSNTITPPPAPGPARSAKLPPEPRAAGVSDAPGNTMFPLDESESPNLVPLPTDDLEIVPEAVEREFDAPSEPARSGATERDPSGDSEFDNSVPIMKKTFPPPPPAAASEPAREDRFPRTSVPHNAFSDDEPIQNSRYVALTRKLAERRGLVGMQGFCPVALHEQRKLVDARPEFLCVYRGRTYRVSSAEAKARFDADPARYAPAAGGLDVVLKSRGQSGVEGLLANAIWFQDRLYLFRTSETASAFHANPGKYVR